MASPLTQAHLRQGTSGGVQSNAPRPALSKIGSTRESMPHSQGIPRMQNSSVGVFQAHEDACYTSVAEPSIASWLQLPVMQGAGLAQALIHVSLQTLW